MMAFRGVKSTEPARLLNFIVRRREGDRMGSGHRAGRRASGTVQLLYDAAEPERYPVSDGQVLEIGPGEVAAQLELRYEHRSPSDDLPTDVLACDFRLADRDGRVWGTTARFTARLFADALFEVSAADPERGLFRPSLAGRDYSRAFEDCPLLRQVRFSSDDRMYRSLWVGGQEIKTQYRYTTLVFDVAGACGPEAVRGRRLAVRVLDGCLYTEVHGCYRSVGELGYYLNCAGLWRHNTAVFSDEDEGWEHPWQPLPLSFTSSGGRGKRQESVKVLSSG
jgi:hypothetical protein